jgi:dTDP-4-amino-4,6-dideoxygalactose transaminase
MDQSWNRRTVQLMWLKMRARRMGGVFFEAGGQWKKAGSMGRARGGQLYPGKNLGACGEAGAVTTNDAEIAKKIRTIRDHGQAKKYYHDIEGYNGRLDAIQAGFLSVKLKHLPAWNEQRRQAARRYRELFGVADVEIRLPEEPSWAKSVYHLYVVRVRERDQFQKCLAEAKIGTGIHYPTPLHLQRLIDLDSPGTSSRQTGTVVIFSCRCFRAQGG